MIGSSGTERRDNLGQAQALPGNPNVNYKVSRDVPSPGNSTAEYDATIRLVSLSLEEPPRERDPKVPKRELRRNQTLEFSAPYESFEHVGYCDGSCADELQSDGSTGDFYFRQTRGDILGAEDPYLGAQNRFEADHELRALQSFEFPYPADSAKFTATIRIDDAQTIVEDAGSNAYAYIAVELTLVKWGYYIEQEASTLLAVGNCEECTGATRTSIQGETIEVALTLTNPDGTLPDGDYEARFNLYAAARPGTLDTPAGSVVTSAATAEIAATLEKLTIEFDPAPFPESA